MQYYDSLRVGTRLKFTRLALQDGRVALLDDAYEISEDTLAVLRPSLIGICSSDIREVTGERRHRSDFGHEVVGDVVYSRETAFPAGTRVTINPNVAPVVRCTCFASMVWLEASPQLADELLIRVPAGLDNDRAVFAEPAACAHRAAYRLVSALPKQLKRPQIVVFGAGIMGFLIGLWLRRCGCSVMLANRSPDRLSFAVGKGIYEKDSVIVNSEIAPLGSFDAAVLATASISTDMLMLATRVVRSNGIIVIFGGTTPNSAGNLEGVDLHALRTGEGTTLFGSTRQLLLGSYGAETRDFEAAIDALLRDGNLVKIAGAIQARVELCDVPSMFERYRGGFRAAGKTVAIN